MKIHDYYFENVQHYHMKQVRYLCSAQFMSCIINFCNYTVNIRDTCGRHDRPLM